MHTNNHDMSFIAFIAPLLYVGLHKVRQLTQPKPASLHCLNCSVWWGSGVCVCVCFFVWGEAGALGWPENHITKRRRSPSVSTGFTQESHISGPPHPFYCSLLLPFAPSLPWKVRSQCVSVDCVCTCVCLEKLYVMLGYTNKLGTINHSKSLLRNDEADIFFAFWTFIKICTLLPIKGERMFRFGERRPNKKLLPSIWCLWNYCVDGEMLVVRTVERQLIWPYAFCRTTYNVHSKTY